MTDTGISSQAYIEQRTAELMRLHQDLLELMRRVPLHDEPDENHRIVTTLKPDIAQQRDSNTLLGRYREWCESIAPFLERSPTAPANEFAEIHSVLSSYFSHRRVGADIDHATWRMLFDDESTNIVHVQI